MKKVIFKDLGIIEFEDAWQIQEELLKEKIAIKIQNRRLIELGEKPNLQTHHLLFCEHHPVYTLGKSGTINHLLLNEQDIKTQGFKFFKINRGGDITYHGPGQIVGYPIFDMDYFFTDIHKYIRLLEEAIIRTLVYYGLKGIREEGYTGVWLEGDSKKESRKICAIGVHLSRWVTMHGFAFNINTNLSHFSNIIPCGIQENNRGVTSLQNELGKTIPLHQVKEILLKNLQEIFSFQSVIE
jgi:lipoyl(octanoyl) transferase